MDISSVAWILEAQSVFGLLALAAPGHRLSFLKKSTKMWKKQLDLTFLKPAEKFAETLGLNCRKSHNLVRI